jgi:hypothetical protein
VAPKREGERLEADIDRGMIFKNRKDYLLARIRGEPGGHDEAFKIGVGFP